MEETLSLELAWRLQEEEQQAVERQCAQERADAELAWRLMQHENGMQVAGEGHVISEGNSCVSRDLDDAEKIQAEQERQDALIACQVQQAEQARQVEAARSQQLQAQKDAEVAAALEVAEGLVAAAERKSAQAAQDEWLVALLDKVSKETLQDVGDIDRGALTRDHDGSSPTFECPILLIDLGKGSGEGTCIGQWNQKWCNHWVSSEALRRHILESVECGVSAPLCPVCLAGTCERCIYHPEIAAGKAPCCTVPPRQVRAVLTAREHAWVLETQERLFRSLHHQDIVQCPHPDCDCYYAVDASDQHGPQGTVDTGDTRGAPVQKWRPGRDMWCEKCKVQYCLHCGEALGTLVRWHKAQTCGQFLKATENSKVASQRRRSEHIATAEHLKGRGVTWQMCPKCKVEAWKLSEHCNRVICHKSCGAEFCFLCGQDITQQRYNHFAERGVPCYNKVWHRPDARPGNPCKCGACR